MSAVLAIAPYYLPYPGGAEKSMHEMLRRMVQLGFTAEALVPCLPSPAGPIALPSTQRLDGVLVRRLETRKWIAEVADRVGNIDLIFFTLAHIFRSHFDTHLDRIMKSRKRRVIYFCRGGDVMDYFPAALVVANSQAVLDGLPMKRGVRTCLLKPIVSEPTAHPQLTRKFVTVINPSEFKGGEVFRHLAGKFLEVPFLAQLGRSEPVKGLERLPNVTIREPDADLSLVYAETKILLVPTKEEPFGRVAIEGALAGCLLLLHRAYGLREVPVPDFCFVDNLRLGVWEQRLSEMLAASENLQADLRAQIQRMAATYDPGWDAFIKELRLLMAAEEEANHQFGSPLAIEEHERVRADIRCLNDLFTIYLPLKLRTSESGDSNDSWRCKLVVTGPEAVTCIIESVRGKLQVIPGDGQANSTVTVSGADLLDLARESTSVEFLLRTPGRLAVGGSDEVASKLVRLLQ